MEAFHTGVSVRSFGPARSRETKAVEHACGELRRRILACRMVPGIRIQEGRLAAEIGIRREELRQACTQLAWENLLRPEKRGGFRVAGLSLDDIRELCELRRIVEAQAAALAARHARPRQVAQLEALAEMNYRRGERRTYVQYVAANTAFHQHIARAAGNARLEAVIAYVLIQLGRPMCLALEVGLNPGKATAQHLLVVDAIRRKRPTLAYRRMWDQLGGMEKRILAAVNHEARGAAGRGRGETAGRKRLKGRK